MSGRTARRSTSLVSLVGRSKPFAYDASNGFGSAGQIGFAPSPAPRNALDEARECLRHLLDAAADDGRTVRALLAMALDDCEPERLMLQCCGIRVYPDREVFVVANQHPFLARVFQGTEWSMALGHVRVLRRLPGTEAVGPVRIANVHQRGTTLSAGLLDEFVP